jgi:hypothetical protein
MKKVFFIAALYFCYTVSSISQDITVLGHEIEWSEGKITLTSGESIKGVVRYNSKSGVLGFDDGKGAQVFTPRSVLAFEYFDAIRDHDRKFYSIEVEDAKGIKRPQFFEVIRELQNFAVIATENPLQLKVRQTWDPLYATFLSTYGYNTTNNAYVSKTVAQQIEILYLIDMEGEINPYMLITYEEQPRSFSFDTKSKSKAKIVGDDAFKELTAPYYQQLKSYAKASKLSFNNKGDFLKILDHYEELVEKN